MNTHLHWTAIALVALSTPHLLAQPPDPALIQNPNVKPDDVWEAKVLTVDPAPEPVPAFQYRLLPLSSENTPGDAAPMYLRLRHETRDEAFLPMTRDAPAWLDMPFDTFPLGDAKSLVGSWTGRLKLIDIAARRSYCDWSYPVREQSREMIQILLPDAQELRSWSRLLALKARVEIRDEQFDDALNTLQTGLAMGRHLGDGPFLINGLVGMACCQSLLDRVEEFVGQPGAPNLYWALTALPRPMISLRDAYELEQRLGENLVPELDELNREHTPEGWDALLARLLRHMQELGQSVISDDESNATLKALLAMDLPSFRLRTRDAAFAWAGESRHFSEQDIASLPESRVLAEYIAARYRNVRDAVFKAAYLPLDQSRTVFEGAERQLAADKSDPISTSFAQMLPSIAATVRSQARLDRRVAALRTVEALRMHAAAHDGELPSSLDDVDLVPVPLDPAMNQPFSYERDPDDPKSALLTAPRLDDQPKTEVAYQIRMR